MVQLESHKKQLAEIGIAVAGMTYDSREILADFHAAENLSYPLLRDEQARHVNALGVRNEDYKQGHQAFGIPYPGILFLDSKGVIRAKYAVPGYRQRPPFAELIAHISSLLHGS